MAGRGRLRRRFWLELALFLASGVLLVATAIEPEWIEVVVGVDPDASSSLLELGLTIAAVIGLGCVVLAGVEWRRAAAASQ